MQQTTNYALKKPDGTDTVDISVLNGNMDLIDNELKKRALTTDIPSVPVQSVNGKTGSITLGAGDILVTDSAKNFSSNPKNIENVLSELFTSASSGKSAIATAAGSPSTSSETFSQLATDITNGKSNIYSAITAKGTTPTTKNFTDLVSAIGNINTGKKYFTGTAVSGQSSKIYNTVNGSAMYEYITIAKSLIPFTPRLISITQAGSPSVVPTLGDLNGLYDNSGTIGHLIVNGGYYVKWDTVCYDATSYYIPVINSNTTYNVYIAE